MTYDYQKPGAGMGRVSDMPQAANGEVRIRMVPLDNGGYDPGGNYWGVGTPLFCIFDAEGHTAYLRAKDFDSARAAFRTEYKSPCVTFAVDSAPSDEDLSDMVLGYVTCALWCSLDDKGESLDSMFSENDIAPESLSAMREDCRKFATDNASIFAACIGQGKCDWSLAGHDYWLTRNGHGCGFWDGDWPKEAGEALSKACRYHEVDLYVGDDGKVYSL